MRINVLQGKNISFAQSISEEITACLHEFVHCGHCCSLGLQREVEELYLHCNPTPSVPLPTRQNKQSHTNSHVHIYTTVQKFVVTLYFSDLIFYFLFDKKTCSFVIRTKKRILCPSPLKALELAYQDMKQMDVPYLLPIIRFYKLATPLRFFSHSSRSHLLAVPTSVVECTAH